MRFLSAIEQATTYLLNNPQDSWSMFVKAHPKADDALNKQAWTDTLPRFQASPAAVDPQRYRRFSEFMKERGLIDIVEPIGRYIGQ